MNKRLTLSLIILVTTVLACASSQTTPSPPAPSTATVESTVSRLESIPSTSRKMTPAEDLWQPVTEGLGSPQALDAPINTAGAEDSPFITLDGQSLYFFFTPDVNIPPEKQLLDGVTGIWRSTWTGSNWGEPERVHLIEPSQLALDGCEFILGDEMWFCSARQGNHRDIDLYIAHLQGDRWTGWQNAGQQINVDYEVGEMHITADGQTMVFASTRPGGLGGYDLWISTKGESTWGEPINLESPVNTAGDESRPYLSPDGQTLWFDAQSHKGAPGPAIFRSIRQADGTWSQPQELVWNFAGEPNLSADGHTLFFVHHYFSRDLSTMIEVDIYSVALP